MSISFDPSRPIFLQLMEEIKRRAARGVYAPGAQLPSVRELAREMEVNPNTVARVYRELEREGFIVTRRGMGTFVTDDPSRIDEERERLARTTVDRFLAEIGDLALTEKQIGRVIDEIGGKLKKRR